MSGQETPEGSMTDRRTLYAVTEGEYSDYRVLCAYEREEDAKAAVAEGVGDDYRQLLLLPPGDIPKRRVMYYANVTMGGGDVDVHEFSFEEWDACTAEVFATEEYTAPGGRRVTRGVRVRGLDKERVAKAIQDAAAKLRAEQEGL